MLKERLGTFAVYLMSASYLISIFITAIDTLLVIVMGVLKLLGYIKWSWLFIISFPLILFAIPLSLFVIGYLIVALETFFCKNEANNSEESEQ